MDLQAKRASLVAQVEQFVGQINRNNGAIALIDDLIAEQAQQEAEEAQEVTFGDINRATNEWWRNGPHVARDYVESPSAAPDWAPLDTIKEMLPSQPEDVA